MTAFPLPTVLGLLFVGLKLTGHIDWSWWYVTMPFWLGFVLIFVISFIAVAVKEARKK